MRKPRTDEKTAVTEAPFTDPNDPSNDTFWGYFTEDGVWRYTGNPDDFWNARSGSVTRGVRQLVWLRRNENLTPKRAAVEIEKRPWLHRAFPSREQWLFWGSADQWPSASQRTSAEAAVVAEGRGFLGRIREPDGNLSYRPQSDLFVEPQKTLQLDIPPPPEYPEEAM